MYETMYFAARSGDNEITVIDLQSSLSYQREDWGVLNDVNLYNSKDAIEYTRDLAKRNGLKYKPFNSRYGEVTNDHHIT